MSTIQLTISMIAFNEEKHISMAIESILAQSYGNFRFLIVNNGSNDRTIEIIKSYGERDARIEIIDEPENDPELCHKLMDQISTEYYMGAAGHDYYAPEFVAKCMASLLSDSSVVMAYTRACWMKGNEILGVIPGLFDTHGLEPGIRGLITSYALIEAYQTYGIYRLSALKAVAKRHVIGYDHVTLAELATIGNFALIDENLFFMRQADTYGNATVYRNKHFPGEPNGVRPFLKMVDAYMEIADRSQDPNERMLLKMSYFTMSLLRYKGVLDMFGETLESLFARPGFKELADAMTDISNIIQHDLQEQYADKKITGIVTDSNRNSFKSTEMPTRASTATLNTTERKARIKIAGEEASTHDLTAVDGESEFARTIADLFTRIRPKRLIETGTYLGEGTTRIIAETVKRLGISDAVFCTIECNPKNYSQARSNLTQRGLIDRVQMLHGLSVPRTKLPTIEEIEQSCVNNIEFNDIFVDHQEQQRALLYYKETDFNGIEDDMLGKALSVYGDRPDFVLLDSGGHMGNVEFNYLISRLKGPCYLALDDIFHIKHHKSFKQMQADHRFEILTVSHEKFGFCLAKFTPEAPLESEKIEHLVWLRPDSIGDAILAGAMLPHIRNKYAEAHITVICQEHIAEFYEACPYINAIVPFNRRRVMDDKEYQIGLLSRLNQLKPDLLLNSVYSREHLTDLLAQSCQARRTVALDGDLSNMTAEMKEKHNRLYSLVISSPGEFKSELERHRDFLAGLGIQVNELTPTAWVTPEDAEWADSVFTTHGFEPDKTIAMFAGAQYAIRHYEGYGEALAPVCEESGMSVIALGCTDDFAISQRNLECIGGRTLNLCGTTTIRQSAALISRCRLAVGAETGLAHLACAVDIPNVVLLGGGHFGRFMPYSPLTTVACLPLECFGCNWNCRYERNHCITDLLPAVLCDAIRSALVAPADRCHIMAQASLLWKGGTGRPAWQSCKNFLNLDNVESIAFNEIHPAPSQEGGMLSTGSSSELSAGSAPTKMVVAVNLVQFGDEGRRERQEECITSINAVANSDIIPLNICFPGEELAPEGWSILPALTRSADMELGINGKRKPFVVDLFNAAAEWASRRRIEWFAISNSDIIFNTKLMDEVYALTAGNCDCIAVSRTDISGPDRNGAYTQDKLEVEGYDIFFCRTDWWLSNKQLFKPYILGERAWDNAYAAIMACHGNLQILYSVGLCHHVKHTTNWLTGPYADYNVAIYLGEDDLYGLRFTSFIKEVVSRRQNFLSDLDVSDLVSKHFPRAATSHDKSLIQAGGTPR